MYQVRKIVPEELESALSLALEVFMKFDAPDYSAEGIRTFKESVIESRQFRETIINNESRIYAAFDKDEMIGVMGVRSGMSHINLAFVREEYHRKGVASALFEYLVNDVKHLHPEIGSITVNSSPYGLTFYERIGFKATDKEQTKDGIRYTPMRYAIHS